MVRAATRTHGSLRSSNAGLSITIVVGDANRRGYRCGHVARSLWATTTSIFWTPTIVCEAREVGASLKNAIMEVDYAAAEPVLIDELQIDARVGPQCGRAPTEDGWPDKQRQFVDQPSNESLGCQTRATSQQICTGGSLHIAYRTRIEAAFEPSVRGAWPGQSRGVDDLVRCLPCARVVGHEVRMVGQSCVGLPYSQGLVHAPPIKVRAGGPHELGDAHEHVVVGRSPVEGPNSFSVKPSRDMFDA